MNFVGMSRREKLQAEARIRRMVGTSKLELSIKAAKADKMYEDYQVEVGKAVDEVDYDEAYDCGEVARYGFTISEGTY
jgi:hypothetical protein